MYSLAAENPHCSEKKVKQVMREMLKVEYEANRGFYNMAMAFLVAVIIGGAMVVLYQSMALPRLLNYFLRLAHPGP